MKIISLNTWGGQQHSLITAFIKEQALTTDIFCFQEVPRTAAHHEHLADRSKNDFWYKDLVEALPDFDSYYAPTHEGFNWRPVEFDLEFGNIIFVRKTLTVLEDGHAFVYREKNTHHMPDLINSNWFTLPRLVQYVRLEDVTVFNFHGLWHVDGKGDMPSRIEQSTKIREVMDRFAGKKILCGDFNLNIDSKSLDIIEAGMHNLIKEFKIDTTRSATHYPKIKEMPYADYTIVSPDIEVTHFEVPKVDVSDHLPMILEFK